MKKTMFLYAILFGALSLCAETISFPLEKLTLKPFNSSSKISSQNGVFHISGPMRMESKEVFAVDPAKKYRISFQVRAVKGAPKGTLSIGFVPVSAKKRDFCGMNVCHNPKATGILAADLKKGDKVIKIKPDADSTGWQVKNDMYLIAINTKKDGSDLPAHQLIRGIEENELKDGIRIITTGRPSAYNAKAGTPVRLHRGGGDYMYSAHRSAKFTEEWSPVIGTVTGVMNKTDRSGYTGWDYNMWPKQAVACRLLVLGNWVKNDAKVEIRDLKLDILD